MEQAGALQIHPARLVAGPPPEKPPSKRKPADERQEKQEELTSEQAGER